MLNLDCRDQFGNTLLNMAVQYGCYDICCVLIKNGADVNATNNDGNTPLHYAISYNFQRLTDLLVEADANEMIKNNKKNTAW